MQSACNEDFYFSVYKPLNMPFIFNDLHPGTFLLVKPIVMSIYKSTIIQCMCTSLQWHAVLSKLCLNGKKMYLFVNKTLGSPPLRLMFKSWGSDFLQASGSILPFSFVHLPIVLCDPVLASSALGR